MILASEKYYQASRDGQDETHRSCKIVIFLQATNNVRNTLAIS